MIIRIRKPKQQKSRGYTCFSCLSCLRESHGTEFFCKLKKRFSRSRQPCKSYEKVVRVKKKSV